MAILADLQALKDKIIASIKGASTNSNEKTRAIEHREVLIDVVDTLENLIPVAINGDDGNDGKSAYEIWLDNGGAGTEEEFLESLNGTDGQDGIDGIDGVGASVYKETFNTLTEENYVIVHNLNSVDLHISLLKNGVYFVNLSDDDTIGDNFIKINNLIPNTEYRIIITAY